MITFNEFLQEMAYSTGSVPVQNKGVLEFDEVDKELYDKFAGTAEDPEKNELNRRELQVHGIVPKKTLGSEVVNARYSFLKPELQEQAKASGIYFENLNTLVVKGRKIEVDPKFTALENRIRNLIPLLTRWSPGTITTRLPLGSVTLNAHARSHHETEVWRELGYPNKETFKKAFIFGKKKLSFTMEKINKKGKEVLLHVDTDSLKSKIKEQIERKINAGYKQGLIAKYGSEFGEEMYEQLMETLIAQVMATIYDKLGKENLDKSQLSVYMSAKITDLISRNAIDNFIANAEEEKRKYNRIKSPEERFFN